MSLTKATNSMIQGASVNVLDFGAVGDGAADDTAAIQAAIDSVCNAGGGEVHLPRGTYLISSTLRDDNTVAANQGGITVRLIGVGASEVPTDIVTTIKTTGAMVGIQFDGNRSGGENFIIQGDGAGANTTSHGVVVQSSRSYWKNIVARDHWGSGFKFEFGNCSHFEHILCISNGSVGFSIDGTGYSTPAGASRPNDCNSSTFITIDCRINGDAGIRTTSGAGFANFFYNVTSQGNAGYGIECRGDYCKFFGVYVESNFAAGSPPTDIYFASTSDYNYLYGVFSNYDGVTNKEYVDASANQRNYVAERVDYTNSLYAGKLQVGNKTAGIPGFLELQEGVANYELTLESTNASMTLDITSSGTGTLTINPDAISLETSIAPTLLNSWVNYGGTRQVAGYYKDKYGIVHLDGVIKSGTTTNPTSLFVLPVGYRPGATIKFATSSNAAFASLFIDSGGNVYYESGSNVDFSLSGIQFRTS
tara:strand:- start:209 stop:1639 length:1431 start_codon:yes stop_codon:yes gene_type:complete